MAKEPKAKGTKKQLAQLDVNFPLKKNLKMLAFLNP